MVAETSGESSSTITMFFVMRVHVLLNNVLAGLFGKVGNIRQPLQVLHDARTRLGERTQSLLRSWSMAVLAKLLHTLIQRTQCREVLTQRSL